MKKIKLIAILLAIICLFTGCKDKAKENVEQTVAAFFTGVQQTDETVSELLIGAGDEGMAFDGISRYFAEELVFEIKSCKKINKQLYTVEAEVQTIDFKNLFESSYKEADEKYGENAAENFLNVMEQHIRDKEYAIHTENCEVNVSRINDEFKIQMDGFLANALTGGMNEYLSSLQGGN